MSTLINCGDGRFIAGDPPTELPVGHHWCPYCGGDGLEHDLDGILSTCIYCYGGCTEECSGEDCYECAQDARDLRMRRLSALHDVCDLAARRALERGDWSAVDRHSARRDQADAVWFELAKR